MKRILPIFLPCFLVASATLAAPAGARDNFLVIIADDVGVDGIGVYSDDIAYGHPGEGADPGQTDRIDGLAAEGILFRNAYTNPVCAPTRAQLLTGRHGFRTEIGVPEQAVLDHSETTLAELLMATHERAALGKWHIGANNDLDHPIDSGFDYYAGGLGGGVGNYTSWDKTTNSTSIAGMTEIDYMVYATTDTAAETVAKINEFGDTPWFIWVAFNAGHTPFHVPEPVGPPLTHIAVDDMSDNPTKFKAAVEAMDYEIGNILDAMSPGVLADTTIIFIGDNGTPSAASEDPFESSHAKGSLYEGGINVPLIIKSPHIDVADQGEESLALVSSVDVFATIAEIAGLSSDAEDSVSMVPYLEDPSRPTLTTRPYVYAERFEPNGPPSGYTDEQRTARNDRYKLIWRNGTYEEFFDLADRPFEDDNLLPVSNLDDEQLAAYNELVSVIEHIAAAGDARCPGSADPSCTTGFTKSSIDWKVKDGSKDRVRARIERGPALAQTDFGDPVASSGTAYGLCAYDDTDSLVAELRVTRPGDECTPGKACWKPVGGDAPDGKGYKYKDKLLVSQGVQKINFKAGDAGKSKIQVGGKGDPLPDGVPATLTGTSSLTLQLRGSDTAQCYSTTLTDISTQDVDRFKARTP